MKTVLDIIQKSTQFLLERGIKNPRKEAVDVIGLSLDVPAIELYMQFDRPLNELELQRCREMLKRRGKHEPYQYIRGKVDFFNASFRLNRHVLIPRQETEILVDRVAKELSRCDVRGKTLWDLCSGSGCIGISLKKAFPELTVILSDLSADALTLAEMNAKENHVDVVLRQGDFLEACPGQRVNYLVCNPPYVSTAEFAELEPEVLHYEPSLALLAQDEGLEFYKRLASQAADVLAPGGKLWVELGCAQGSSVQKIFSTVSALKTELSQDWSGLDRFFFLEME